MSAFCLLVAGALRASIPAQELTLAWTHSVEKSRWEELYRIAGKRLVLDRARVQGSGAGMDPAPDAKLDGGWWVWYPEHASFDALHLTLSPYTHDYDLCWAGHCKPLHTLVGMSTAAAVVDLRPCRGASAGSEQIRR